MNGKNYQVPHCGALFLSLGPKYSSQDPVFKYPNLYSSLIVRDHVSQPYSTAGNIIVSYILIFKFLGRNREDKTVGLNNSNVNSRQRVQNNENTMRVTNILSFNFFQ